MNSFKDMVGNENYYKALKEEIFLLRSTGDTIEDHDANMIEADFLEMELKHGREYAQKKRDEIKQRRREAVSDRALDRIAKQIKNRSSKNTH